MDKTDTKEIITKIWLTSEKLVILIPEDIINSKHLKMRIERTINMKISDNGEKLILSNIDGHLDNIKTLKSKKTL